MSNIFRKPAKEVEINGEKLLISPLKVGTLLQIRTLGDSVAEAIAKLRNVPMGDFEQVTTTEPCPTEGDPTNMKTAQKTTTKAPDISSVSLIVKNKQDGIKALFDCLFKNDLLEEIFRTSVDRFKAVPKGQLFDVESEDSLDVPTALEILMAIVEVNIGGFTDLGKFSRLLTMFQGAAKEVETPAKP
jgi:hypothetical protein